MNELHCDVIQAAFDLYTATRADRRVSDPGVHKATTAYQNLIHAVWVVADNNDGRLEAPKMGDTLRSGAARYQYAIVEQIQDGRPRVTGPLTWDEAEAAAAHPNRFICDFGGLLP